MHLPACRELSWRLRSLRREGVGVETGGKVFDPMGFSKIASAETLAWYRAAELKHSRVAMVRTHARTQLRNLSLLHSQQVRTP